MNADRPEMAGRERLHISGGRLIDPANGIDGQLDVFVADGIDTKVTINIYDMDVVDAIAAVDTGSRSGRRDVPRETVLIESMKRLP